MAKYVLKVTVGHLSADVESDIEGDTEGMQEAVSEVVESFFDILGEETSQEILIEMGGYTADGKGNLESLQAQIPAIIEGLFAVQDE